MTGDAQEPRKKKNNRRPAKKKRRKARSGNSRPVTSEQRAEKIYRLLCDLYETLPGDPPAGPELHVIRFSPDGEASSFSQGLLDTLRSSRDCQAEKIDFQEGRVFCHHCESAACAHAAPPNHLAVFSGYTPTGYPVWLEFFDLVLERANHRVDELLGETPEVAALVLDRETLHAEQLTVFGRDSARYQILGQVVAGYLPFPENKRGRCAVTVQAVQHLAKGREKIGLNVIGSITGGEDLHLHFKIRPHPDLLGLLARTNKKLDNLTPRTRGRRVLGKRLDPEKVHTVLRQFARDLERTFRRRKRRTRHAIARGAERPAVGMALKDLEKADQDHFFRDPLEETFIVVGPKWRVHVFGTDGRHVTSMNLNKDGVQKRVDLKRWQPGFRDDMQALRTRVKQRRPKEGTD